MRDKTVKNLQKLYGLLVSLMVMLITHPSIASSTENLGVVVNEIAQPLDSVASLVHIVCIVTGAGLMMAAFIRYLQHRRNPIEATLSSVFALLFTGIAVLILAFIPMPTMGQANT